MQITNTFVYHSVCTACCMFHCDGVPVECVCYLSRCGSCFVVECYGVDLCLGRAFIA